MNQQLPGWFVACAIALMPAAVAGFMWIDEHQFAFVTIAGLLAIGVVAFRLMALFLPANPTAS
jgi:hypothetical protein